eukprot:6345497-Amphidinium_carterae.1
MLSIRRYCRYLADEDVLSKENGIKTFSGLAHARDLASQARWQACCLAVSDLQSPRKAMTGMQHQQHYRSGKPC